MSEEELQNLKSQLKAQHVVLGDDSMGSITFRGTTITWDPLVVNLNTSSYQQQGQTPNEQALGANLDSLSGPPSPGLLKLLNAIDASGEVPKALSELSPQRYELFSDIAFANANFNTLEIDERLNNLRDGSESVDFSGFNGQDPVGEGPVYGGGKGGDDAKETVAPERPTPKYWGMFASGDAIFSSVRWS